MKGIVTADGERDIQRDIMRDREREKERQSDNFIIMKGIVPVDGE